MSVPPFWHSFLRLYSNLLFNGQSVKDEEMPTAGNGESQIVIEMRCAYVTSAVGKNCINRRSVVERRKRGSLLLLIQKC